MASIILILFLQILYYFFLSVVRFDTIIMTPQPLVHHWGTDGPYWFSCNDKWGRPVISQPYTSDSPLSLSCYHDDEMDIVQSMQTDPRWSKDLIQYMMIYLSFILIFHIMFARVCVPPPVSLSVFLPLILTSQVCIYSQQMGSPMTDTRALSLFKLS